MGEGGFLHLLLTRGRHLTGSRSLPLFKSIHTKYLSGDFTWRRGGTEKHRRAERASIVRCNERAIIFIHQNRLERKHSNQKNQSMNLTYCKNSTIVPDAFQIFCLTRDLQIQREKIAQSLGTQSFSTFLGQGLCHNFAMMELVIQLETLKHFDFNFFTPRASCTAITSTMNKTLHPQIFST